MRVRIPLVIRLVEVSDPPTTVMMQLAMISSSVSRSPSTSAVMNAWSNPSRGWRRSPRWRPGNSLWTLRWRGALPSSRSGLCWKLPRISANVSDQALSFTWSSLGRPIISVVTIAGSGSAYSESNSILPCSPGNDVIQQARGDPLDMIVQRTDSPRAEKQPGKLAEPRVTGGSMNSICLTITLATGATSERRISKNCGDGVPRKTLQTVRT